MDLAYYLWNKKKEHDAAPPPPPKHQPVSGNSEFAQMFQMQQMGAGQVNNMHGKPTVDPGPAPSGGTSTQGPVNAGDRPVTCQEVCFGEKEEEEQEEVPDNFGDYLSFMWKKFAHDSDVWGFLYATPEERSNYGYIERNLVLFHTFIIGLFTAAMTDNVVCGDADNVGLQVLKWIVPSFIEPLFKFPMLSWVIRLIFQKRMSSATNVCQHAVAFAILIAGAGFSLTYMFYGPEDGECGDNWVLQSDGALDKFMYGLVAFLVPEVFCVTTFPPFVLMHYCTKGMGKAKPAGAGNV